MKEFCPKILLKTPSGFGGGGDQLHPRILFKSNSLLGEGANSRADRFDLEQKSIGKRAEAFRQFLREKLGGAVGRESNSFGIEDVEAFHEAGQRSVASRPDIYD